MGNSDIEANSDTRRTILLVEDQAIIAMNESRLLESYGFEVFSAYNGEEAVEVAKREVVDLILMDIDLGRGKMDGTEAAQIILQNRELPIVFLTNHAEKEMVERVKGITRYGYVLKNAGEFVLIESINMAFELFNAHRTTKAREKALERERNTLSSLMETSPVAIVLIDRHGDITYANGQAEKILQLSKKNLYSQSYSDLISMTIHSSSSESEQESESGGTLFELMQRTLSPVLGIEHVIHLPNGEKRYLSINAAPLFSEDDSFDGVISAFNDTTQEKIYKEKLMESTQRFRKIYQHVSIGIAQVGLDYRIIHANQAYCDLLGYSEDELSGTHLKDITHPELVEENLRLQEQLAKGEIDHFRLDKRFIHKSGNTVHGILDANLIRDGKDNPAYFIGSVIDVTEQIENEQRLRESEEKYRTLFKAARDMIIIADAETGKILDANYTAEEKLGKNRSEIIGSNQSEMFPKAFREIRHSSFRDTVQRNQKTIPKEVEIQHSSGRLIPMSINPSVITFDGKKAVMGIFRDISEQVAAEPTKQKQLEEEKLLSRLSGQLILQETELELFDFIADTVEKLTDGGYVLVSSYSETDERAYIKSTSGFGPLLAKAKDILDKNHIGLSFPIPADGIPQLIEMRLKRAPQDLNELNRQAIPKSISARIAQLLQIERIHAIGIAKEDTLLGSVVIILPRNRELKTAHLIESFVRQAGIFLQKIQAEEKVLESNKILLNALNSIPEDIYISDMESDKVLFMNEHMKKSFNKDAVGELCYEAFRGETQRCPFCTTAHLLNKKGKPNPSILWEAFNPISGKWYLNHDKAVQWIDGRYVRLQIATDITDRMQVENLQKRSLQEKDALMRELNHRVSNNLALVSSLINLESEKPAEKIDLCGLNNRVNAIRLLHEKLYKSDTAVRIEFGPYIEDLICTVFSAFSKSEIRFVNEIEEITLSSECAIPLGLIVNELATNTLKYGANGQGNEFRVSMKRTRSEENFVLTVSNNGSPIPESVSIDPPHTMGLRLIYSLVRQLDGTLDLIRSPSPQFIITLPNREMEKEKGKS